MTSKASLSAKRIKGAEPVSKEVAGLPVGIEPGRVGTAGDVAERLGIKGRQGRLILENAKLRMSPETFWECLTAFVDYYRHANRRHSDDKINDLNRKTKAEANRAEREEALAAGELCWKSEVVAGYADAFAKLVGVIKNFDGMSQSAKERLSVELGKVKFVKPTVATP